MKKILLAIVICALPLAAQVSNPSIIPVASAPSGSCTAGLPNQQVVSTGVQYSCQAGTWGAINGGASGVSQIVAGTNISISPSGGTGAVTVNSTGAGSLPTATAPGQIISSTASGTTYAVQPQVFYAQSTDTIASIESECSSACTYISTIPQTFTISADHTLAANVFVQWGAGGKWTVNGAHTFTFTNFPASDSLTQHLAGTSTLRGGSGIIPFEWLGVLGFSTKAGAAAGSDYGVQAQRCLDFLIGSGGWCQMQPLYYNFTTGPLIVTSNIGIHGRIGRDSFNSGGPDAHVSSIVSNAASGTMLAVQGLVGQYITTNSFKDFAIERQVQCTSTTATDCIGIRLQYAEGTIIENITSNDNLDHLYYNGAPSIAIGHHWSFGCNNGLFPSLVNSYTAGQHINCEDGDSDNGVQTGTIITQNVTLFTQGTAGCSNGVISSTYNIHGTHINDQNLSFPGAAGDTCNGVLVTYTGSGAADSEADIQIVQPSIEAALVGIGINGLSSLGGQPSVIIAGGGYILGNTAGAKLIDCENSQKVMVTGGLELITAAGAPSITGVYENGCSGGHIGPIVVENINAAVNLVTTTDTTVSGVNATNTNSGISLTSISVHNSIVGNSINGTFTSGYSTDSTSTANESIGNTCSTTTNCIAGSGFNGFVPSALAAGSTVGGVPISTGNCMAPMKVVVGSPVTTITFASIPQTCTNLRLTLAGENSAPAGDFVGVFFNGDTGANYNYVFIDANITTAPVWTSATGAASATPDAFYLAGAVTNGWSQGSGFIANYTGTTFRKGISITGLSDDNPSSNVAFTYQVLESWNATPAAITQIDLIAGAGFNFVAGTVATLTGD